VTGRPWKPWYCASAEDVMPSSGPVILVSASVAPRTSAELTFELSVR
jgi:hypothetical protein